MPVSQIQPGRQVQIGPLARPVNGWPPQKRLPDKRRADLHSVRPTLTLRIAPPGMADIAGDGRFPGSRVVASTTFPGRNPVVFGAGFPLTVAGAAPASPGIQEDSQIARA